MKRIVSILTAVVCVGTAVAFAGCSEETVPEGRVGIKFWYEADMNTNPTYYELVKTYNDTQGAEDGVYVSPTMISGVGDERSTYEGSCEASVVLMSNDSVFKGIAMDGLFVDLSGYVEEDGFDLSDMPAGGVNAARLTVSGSGEKIYAGEGQSLLGMPFGSSTSVLYYNISHFNAVGINVISCEEERLAEEYPNVRPHGYAEYKQSPFEGAVASTNLAGQTVYKVFNNRIPTNWEELRYLGRMLTKSYNPAATSTYGYLGEYWFQYGWSVGGDCIGYDGEKYNFTLFDQTPGYLATQAVTVNGHEYAAGEVVSYEDKVNQEGIGNMDGLHKLPSQYDAALEFVRLSNATNEYAESGVPGYGVTPESNITGAGAVSNQFLSGEVAIILNTFAENINNYNRSMRGNFNVAPAMQYREYEGGSTYQSGGNDFAHEYLYVIGETYDLDGDGAADDVYTGELLYENGTPIVGTRDVMSRYCYLVIPTNSDPTKYEAAWKFISWAAGVEGQEIMVKTGRFEPNQDSVAFGSFANYSTDINYYAVADASRHGDIGDWAYFEDGEWVNDWAGDFNSYLRTGDMTIAEFLEQNETAAQVACEQTRFVILGRR